MPVPLPGTAAPDFDVEVLLPDLSFSRRKLSDYYGSVLLLVFYPGDFTALCPNEVISFSNLSRHFQRKYNTRILMGSTDSLLQHYNWSGILRQNGGIGVCSIDLFADRNRNLSMRYGVLHTSGRLSRALFLISGDGNIVHVSINDYACGRSIADVESLLQDYQSQVLRKSKSV